MPKSFHKRTSFGLSKHTIKSLNEDFETQRLFASGHNNHNMTGRTKPESSSPVQVFSRMNRNWKMVTVGEQRVLGIRNDDTCWSWGNDSHGQLGQRGQVKRRTSPTLVFPEYNWIDVFQGVEYNNESDTVAVAVRSDGTLWSWGSNNYGSLGLKYDANFEKHSSPIQIGTDTDWSFTFFNEGIGHSQSGHGCGAGKNNGTFWQWGYNGHGQLGNGTTSNTNSPVQMLGTGWTNKISKGYQSCAAIKNDDTLWSWGFNSSHGQLGINNTQPQSSPIQIGSSANWSKVTCGGHHTLALNSSNQLYAWGHNPYGQVGNILTVDISSPIQIPGVWTDIAAGMQFSIGVKSGGTLWSWGHNQVGNLGQNNTTNYSSPMQIGALTTWTNVWASGRYFFARKSDGSVSAAGDNRGRSFGLTNFTISGQETNPDKSLEEDVQYSSPIQIISTGGNTWNKVNLSPWRSYIIDSSNNLRGMGMNEQANLGFFGSKGSPVQVPGLWNWVNTSTNSTYGIKKDRSLWFWGHSNHGQSGNRNNTNPTPAGSPAQIGSDTDWEMVAGNYHSAYAKKTNGSLWSWGHNGHGALGLNNGTNYSSPMQIPGNWKTVNTTYGTQGVHCVFGIKSDGTAWSWGHNPYGQIRSDWARKYSSPIQIYGNISWTSVSSNDVGNIYAIKSDNTLWALGNNAHGQLGNLNTNSQFSSPIQVGGAGNNVWQQVQAGGHHCLAKKTDGGLWGWGHNNYGQIGNNTISSTINSPVQVTGGAAGSCRNFHTNRYHSSSVRNDSYLYTWGYNGHGQIGNNTTINYSDPIQIGSNQWRQSSCGNFHTSCVRNDGTLWTWGYNINGQLGTNSTVSYSSPIQIGTLTNWSTTHCGMDQTFAIKTDGSLWAWGANNSGQLGVNSPIQYYSSPVQIPGNLWNSLCSRTNYEASDNDNRGDYGSIMVFATKTDNTLWSWGKYYNFQHGQTINTQYSSPVQIPGNWKGAVNNSGSFNDMSFSSRQPFSPGRYSGLMVGNDNAAYLYQTGVYFADQSLGNQSPIPEFASTPQGDVSSPIQVMSGTFLQASACQNNLSILIRSDNTLWVWGHNNHGSLGSGDRMNRSSPHQIAGDDWISARISSYGSLVALNSKGQWWGVGYNGHGALGTGKSQALSMPVQAPGSNFTLFENIKSDRYNVMYGNNHSNYAAKEIR